MFLLTHSLVGFAQPAPNKLASGCSYDGNPVEAAANPCAHMSFSSNDDAEESIDNMLRHLGLKRNFAVVECPGIRNCRAVVLESIRFIIYDSEFLNRFRATNFAEVSLNGHHSTTDWTAVSIMAHELAHHLNGHTLQEGGSRPDLELEADEFSGFILFKLGATLAQAQQAMRNPMISDKGSYTHPPRQQRLDAIARGWNDAKNIAPIPSIQPVEPPKPSTQVVVTPPTTKTTDKPIVLKPLEELLKDIPPQPTMKFFQGGFYSHGRRRTAYVRQPRAFRAGQCVVHERNRNHLWTV